MINAGSCPPPRWRDEDVALALKHFGFRAAFEARHPDRYRVRVDMGDHVFHLGPRSDYTAVSDLALDITYEHAVRGVAVERWLGGQWVDAWSIVHPPVEVRQ